MKDLQAVWNWTRDETNLTLQEETDWWLIDSVACVSVISERIEKL